MRFADYPQLDASDRNVLTALYPSGSAPLWGTTPGLTGSNISRFEKVAAGDFVFFSGGGRLFAGGTVTHTFRSHSLAQALWGTDDRSGQTWELMYALDELRGFDVPYPEMNRVLGYAANNIVQGFSVLDEARSAALFSYLDLDSDVHPPVVTSEQFQAATTFDGETERQVLRSQRLEQTYLRRRLLPGVSGSCALCGRDFPAEFLVAAHIKKRAACSPDERRDVAHVAMLACKFGCDSLYEEGYLGVGPDGRVMASLRLKGIQSMGSYRAHVDGRVCAAHDPASAGYFAWHWQNTFRDAAWARP